MRIAAKINIYSSLIFLISPKKKPANDDNGIANPIIVYIFPPYATPNISTAQAGNIVKWPPSVKKAKDIKIEYIIPFALK